MIWSSSGLKPSCAQFLDVFRSDALHLHTDQVVCIRMQAEVVHLAHILWSNVLNFQSDQLVDA